MSNYLFANQLSSARDMLGPMTDKSSTGDPMDNIVAAWRRERPDLDLAAIAVAGRLGRLALRLARAQDDVLGEFELQNGGFDVLAALRRAGKPYTLTPSQLSESLLLSRAGMTSRLDRLESAGFLERALDSDDRRSFRIQLTKAGLKVVDLAMTKHTANVTRLLSPLSARELASFDGILRKFLHHLAD
jgi:DNA-binding MarR family transcriptional regulator